jgi:hypothetical protein
MRYDAVERREIWVEKWSDAPDIDRQVVGSPQASTLLMCLKTVDFSYQLFLELK